MVAGARQAPWLSIVAENTEELEPLVTRCPECSTRFRVTETQLQVAGGRVRCGSCLTVFFGTDHLQWDLEQPAVATDPAETLDQLLREIDVFEATESGVVTADSGAGFTADPLQPPVRLADDETPDGREPDGSTVAAESTPDAAFDPGSSGARIDPDAAAPATTTLATFENPEDADFTVEALPTHDEAGLEDVRVDAPADSDRATQGDTFALDGAATGLPAEPDASADDGFEVPAAAPETPVPEPAQPELSLTPASVHGSSLSEPSLPEPSPFEPLGAEPPLPATPPEDRFVRLWDDLPTGVDVLPEAPDTPAPQPDPAEVLPLAAAGDAPPGRAAAEDPAAQPMPAAGLPDSRPVVLSPADLLLEPPPPGTRRRYWRALAATAGLLLVGAQVVWYFLPGWAADPAMRWLPERLCAVAGCRLEPLRALDQLLLTDVILRGDPERPEQRLVNLLIVNTASFDQAFPDVEIAFSAPTGDVVAWKRFAPADYLAGELLGQTTIPAKTPVRIELQVQDPGTQSYGYEISLK